MEDDTKQKLRQLAMDWRTKAESVREKYRDASPFATQVAVEALETCAAELEELILKI